MIPGADGNGRAVELLRRLDAGDPVVRVERAKAKAEPKLDLSSFRGRLDLTRQAVAGKGTHANHCPPPGLMLPHMARAYRSAPFFSAHRRG